MNKQALIKLAHVRLAINHVLRNRMVKRAEQQKKNPYVAGAMIGAGAPLINRYIPKAQRATAQGIDTVANYGHNAVDSTSNMGHGIIDRMANAGHHALNRVNNLGHKAVSANNFVWQRMVNPRGGIPSTQRPEYRAYSQKHIDVNGDPLENQEYYDNMDPSERTPQMENDLMQSYLNYFDKLYEQQGIN